MEPYNGKLQMVDPKKVVVDHRYQRDEKQSLINAISANPKWELFGVLVLFEREGKPGNYYCADGQQRLRGVMGAEQPPEKAPAVVFTVPALRDEAAIYVQINEFRKALRPLEKHLGKVVAKDAAALSVEKAVLAAGFSIGQSPSTRTIEAPTSLYYAHNALGEQGLVQLLTVIKDAWPDDKQALSAMIIRTLSNIIEEKSSNGGFSRSDLTRKLLKTSPGKIARKAEEIHFDTGKSKGDSTRAAFKVLAKV
jgi:hypothetical protein